jgi:hypothetical protein
MLPCMDPVTSVSFSPRKTGATWCFTDRVQNPANRVRFCCFSKHEPVYASELERIDRFDRVQRMSSTSKATRENVIAKEGL